MTKDDDKLDTVTMVMIGVAILVGILILVYGALKSFVPGGQSDDSTSAVAGPRVPLRFEVSLFGVWCVGLRWFGWCLPSKPGGSILR